MAKPDYRINEHGIDVRDLRVGQLVKVWFNDSPDQLVILTEIESYQSSYKGERGIEGLILEKDGWRALRGCHVNTQVKEVIGMLHEVHAMNAIRTAAGLGPIAFAGKLGED